MRKYLGKGALVKAIQGRESGQVFIVLDADEEYAYIANGKTRTIEQPKKKNKKHLYLLLKSEDVNLDFTGLTNAHIIKYIKDYNKSRDYK
ncbi:MAG: hypothetical protein E7354_02160 [Clostridiales bacterium]|nr:hypothetical protein [Clostridiales bacterium]